MADAGTRAADKAQAEIVKRLRAVYRNAQKEIIEQLDEQTKRMNALDAVKRRQLEAGEITQAQYKSWLMGQLFAQKQWKDKVDSVAITLLYANKQANDIVEGKKRAVFGENASYQAFQLEKGMNVDMSFSVYDSSTVTRLLKNQPELLPRKVVNGVKDKAWNRKKISNAVAQGIIQGDSIPDIANRIAKQTASSNMTAMTRYARTAMTSAQNAGRMEVMHEAEDMGIKVKKRWTATLDKRTRDAHAELDGQTVDIDEPFHSSLGDIMYPGDPSADPANVYNCRCTLTYVYPEYTPKQSGQRRDNTNGEVIKDMTYGDWKAWSEAGKPSMDSWERNQLTEAQKDYIMSRDYSNAVFSLPDDHLEKHYADYGVKSSEELLVYAREVMAKPINADTPAILRSDDAVERYCYSTNDFVVGAKDGTIKTIFKPKIKSQYWRGEYERN